MDDEMRTRRQRARLDGMDGETVAMTYLKTKGYGLLASNYRHGHREIDLVMTDNGTVVFVEVKTRRDDALVAAPLAVDRQKQCKLYSAAAHFLRTRAPETPARFDIVWVETDCVGRKRVAGHIKDAFSPFAG